MTGDPEYGPFEGPGLYSGWFRVLITCAGIIASCAIVVGLARYLFAILHEVLL